MTRPSPPNWSIIEIDYRGDSLTLAQIAQKHEVSLSAISKARQRKNWPKRSRLNLKNTKSVHKKSTCNTKVPSRKHLIGRMFVVLEKQIERMEKIMPENADDKEIVLLGQLVRSLEKLVELDIKHRDPEKSLADSETKNSRQMQDLRTRLSQRMHQLESE